MIEKPTLEVEVAEPLTVRPERVVVPKPELETRNHGAVVEPIHSEKFVPATEFTASVPAGVVVPTPRDPVKNEVLVDVERSDETVRSDDVAIKLPEALDVMIELIGNDVCPVPPDETGSAEPSVNVPMFANVELALRNDE